MAEKDPMMIQISLQALAKMVKFDLSKIGTETVGLLIGYEADGIVRNRHLELVQTREYFLGHTLPPHERPDSGRGALILAIMAALRDGMTSSWATGLNWPAQP